jgi:hypothetical protein
MPEHNDLKAVDKEIRSGILFFCSAQHGTDLAAYTLLQLSSVNDKMSLHEDSVSNAL